MVFSSVKGALATVQMPTRFSVVPERAIDGPEQGRTRSGGRRWWAHLNCTRMNIDRIILENQLEDLMELMEIMESVRSSGAFGADRDFAQCLAIAGPR